MNCRDSYSKPQKPEKTPPDEKEPVPNTTRLISETPRENDQAPLLPRWDPWTMASLNLPHWVKANWPSRGGLI